MVLDKFMIHEAMHDFKEYRKDLLALLSQPTVGEYTLDELKRMALTFPHARNIVALLGKSGEDAIRMEIAGHIRAFIDTPLIILKKGD